MFEKEAEEIEKEAIKWVKDVFPNDEFKQSGISRALVEFAELGYNKAFVEADKNLKAIITDFNKANEWHYMKDGIMPAENQWVLVYDGSYTVCNYHSNTPIKWLDNYENEVYEGYIIAWKEIELPKEIKK